MLKKALPEVCAAATMRSISAWTSGRRQATRPSSLTNCAMQAVSSTVVGSQGRIAARVVGSARTAVAMARADCSY